MEVILTTFSVQSAYELMHPVDLCRTITGRSTFSSLFP